MSDLQALIDRLAAHRTLGGVPREQLEWLARHGHLKTLAPGDVLTQTGVPVAGLYVLFSGHLTIHIDRGAGTRLFMEWHSGDVTGLLPYSRLRTPPGNVVAEQVSEVLVLDPPFIDRMIRECHELTAVLVHVMIDRARMFTSSELQNEKMASLGRLAAGLAHELNNPASAVARSAKALVAELERLDGATREFCQLNLSDTQCFRIAALRDERTATTLGRSPLEMADREDALSDWLEARGVSGVDLEPLATTDFAPDDLEALRATIGVDKLAPVLTHIATGQTVRKLASEINAAASRIHALVDAVKGFTYMDQQTTLQPIDISRGLRDTIAVLGPKARAKAVDLQLDVAADLPAVDGYGGELNQVWANLIDNAIDASRHGNVRIFAGAPVGSVVVRIIDDGPGIPPDIASRMFDPFFTTKPVGEGTGLGLDIARRIVHRHHGLIDLITGELGTEFRVTLPVSASAASTH